MAYFYHNWTSNGQEISIEVPDFTNVFVCGSNCNNAYPPALANTFAQQLLNGATLSPASTPLMQLHDMRDYLTDLNVLADQYKNWALQNAAGNYDCYAACINWRCWLCGRWNCHEKSAFCNWSSGSMSTHYIEWTNEYNVAVAWDESIINLIEQTEQAIADEGNFIMLTTQIDIMKSKLQESMAQAGILLSNAQYIDSMNKTKSVFLPVMAVLLIVVIAFFLIANTKK